MCCKESEKSTQKKLKNESAREKNFYGFCSFSSVYEFNEAEIPINLRILS